MIFVYRNDENQIVKLSLKAGDNINSADIKSDALKSILGNIDDGDGVIQECELNILEKYHNKFLESIEKQFGKKFKPNSILTRKGLQMLANRIDSGELDIFDVMDKLNTVNYDNYSKKALEKRFPADRYEIKVNNSFGEDITITDKNTGKIVFERIYCGGENHETAIREYNSHGEEILFRVYDENSKLQNWGYKKKLHYEILANSIYDDIKSESKDKLKILNKHFFRINADNVEQILKEYRELNNTSLLKDINKYCKDLSEKQKQKYISHLNKCLNKALDYSPDYKNPCSKVSNKYHQGDFYYVECKNNILTATNRRTGKETTIDLNKIVNQFDIDVQIRLKKAIQQLPGEVIEDMFYEVDEFKTQSGISDWLRKLIGQLDGILAYYSPASDNITLGINGSDPAEPETFVHELGHAIYYSVNDKNLDIIKLEFIKTFNYELKKYKSDGHSIYGDNNDYQRPNSNISSSTYATACFEEMFAECYAYLMLGKCGSDALLEDYFNETLKVANRLLNQIRKSDKS